jgi:hypothetical protein
VRADTKAAMNDWLAALGKPRSDDGQSAAELSAAWGVCNKTVMERLRALHQAGRLSVGKRQTTNLIGRSCSTPVYRLLKAKR